MTSPYSDLPPRAFWRSAVTEREPLDPGDLYQPRFPITKRMRIATAGSCFAQHVGRALRGAGFNVMDAEPAPNAASTETAAKFGYGQYSARYGNIYTVRQLVQLLDEAAGRVQPALPVWQGPNGRWFDAQRPSVEPDGLDSAEDVLAHRTQHLAAVGQLVANTDLFVFTLGLTEAWVHTETGTVYPTVPGTIAGTFDPDVFSFKNYGFTEILSSFQTFRAAMRAHNPKIRFLITVSPVPLTATASGQHVEVATVYSKSVLRAVCGTLTERFRDVDYFPSFEIITSINNRGVYYEANKRNVSALGVRTAMSTFMAAHDSGVQDPSPQAAPQRPRPARTAAPKATEDENAVACEDALLEAFQK